MHSSISEKGKAKQNQRRTVKRLCIHYLENNTFVTISSYIFKLVLKIIKLLCKHGYLIFFSRIELEKLFGNIWLRVCLGSPYS